METKLGSTLLEAQRDRERKKGETETEGSRDREMNTERDRGIRQSPCEAESQASCRKP